ncbi:MAG: ABC transporter permease [bacterium]
MSFACSFNPIMVKELRQAVRSRFVTNLLMVFAFLLLIPCWMCLSDAAGKPINFNAGRELFYTLFGILTFVSLQFVPIYTAVRFALERSRGNMDLLFITTLTQSAIIRGKLLVGMIITILLFSICMPFMVFTYLLRGIDIPSMIVLLSALFLIITVSTGMALLIASIPAGKIFRIILGIPSLIFLWYLTFFIIFSLGRFISFGLGSWLFTWKFWGIIATILILGLMVLGAFFRLCVFFITPFSANRALPVRLYLTASWLVGFVLAEIWAYSKSDLGLVKHWMLWSIVLFSLALIMTVGEGDEVSTRVARTIPHSPLLRPCAFLFYNGSAGGISWATLMVLCTVTLALFFPHAAPGAFTEIQWVMVVLFLYAFNYSMTASLIRKKFIPKKIPRRATWIIIIVMISMGALLPALLEFFFTSQGSHPLSLMHYGNIFTVAKNSFDAGQLLFLGVWAIIICAVRVPWFVKQVTGFKPG